MNNDQNPDRRVCIQHSGIEEKINSLCNKIDERDRNYHERDLASKDAIKVAYNVVKEASHETALALKEYKISANEWRDTVKDLIARMITRPDVERELKVISDKIADLQESRSQIAGGKIERVEKRTQSNWLIGVVVVALMALISNIILVISMFFKK